MFHHLKNMMGKIKYEEFLLLKDIEENTAN